MADDVRRLLKQARAQRSVSKPTRSVVKPVKRPAASNQSRNDGASTKRRRVDDEDSKVSAPDGSTDKVHGGNEDENQKEENKTDSKTGLPEGFFDKPKKKPAQARAVEKSVAPSAAGASATDAITPAPIVEAPSQPVPDMDAEYAAFLSAIKPDLEAHPVSPIIDIEIPSDDEEYELEERKYEQQRYEDRVRRLKERREEIDTLNPAAIKSRNGTAANGSTSTRDQSSVVIVKAFEDEDIWLGEDDDDEDEDENATET
ncbi:hypothetical protein BC832DRAFT_554634 [Gaertneriomyces semiglobifer]|nr:hypothetical protein BC832DRAFT_554634 [Gaertneriomyces semiglobifer]